MKKLRTKWMKKCARLWQRWKLKTTVTSTVSLNKITKCLQNDNSPSKKKMKMKKTTVIPRS